jgi:hypothetical protein
MAESIPLEDIEIGEKSSQCRYFKAKVLTDHTAEQINDTIKESISEKSILFQTRNILYLHCRLCRNTHNRKVKINKQQQKL